MPDEPTSIEPDAFRRTIARWPTGVCVVTARGDGADQGLTVNSLTSISLHPPLVLIALTDDAEATPVVRTTRRFAVSVLAVDQRAISERFAKAVPGAEKFGGVSVHRTPGGLAVLDGAIAAFECEVRSERMEADHHVFVAEVRWEERGRDASPLVFFRSRYAEGLGVDGLRLASPPPEGARL